ncbi:methyltransferase domain-containing protein [Pseudoalteromonas piscicida]|uniref:methyltransferase domain-containing protein n=1 Tax=Pseudoalteromonas piscicida TaxID=43662 RepID=UPI000E35963F|nr:methyltransferase domain-containing protein [Pseudoalteromonas piscicida]AXQ99543.1 methyltransferase domain-containing protein [Pseudoalteromonas piscicida]
MEKVYPFGYNSAAVGIMQSRTAQDNAALFLDYVQDGDRILDVGCGPGSITMDFAERFGSSEVYGIDIEQGQIDMATAEAQGKGLQNCHFKAASIFELPYEDGFFDAVYGHTILMQFSNVHDALTEVKRVLKPGGIISFREVDLGQNFYHGSQSAIKRLMDVFAKSIEYNQGNPNIGRALPKLVGEAGYAVEECVASYSQPSTPTGKMMFYKSMLSLWNKANFTTQAVDLKWITVEQRDEIAKQLKQESRRPDVLAAINYVEVVGRNK